MDFFEIKAGTIGFLYRNILRPVLFLIEPERVHNWFIDIGWILGGNYFTKLLTRWAFDYEDKMLEQNILGIKFRNPVGLAAGFDKNAEMVSIMEDVGFGFSEVGSITALSSRGNIGTRMKRIPEKKALWINLGLNNLGADKIADELRNRKYKIPFGISIAKTNCKENADDDSGVRDYIYSMRKFSKIGDYITLNVSCPNAFGGLPFHHPDRYEKLLKAVSKLRIKKPVFVKLSPDIDKKDLDKIIDISKKYGVSGFVCSNLTKNGDGSSGGYSGKYVGDKANKMISYIYKKTKGKFIIIGVGGIYSASDAYRKIKLGASLVQLVTGMIYEGPQIIGEINCGLLRLMKKDGFSNISEVVGKGV